MSGGFTVDWTARSVPVFEKYLAPLMGQQNISGLELGVFEGRTTCWLMEHVLTDIGSQLLCIDPFEGLYGVKGLDAGQDMMNVERRWEENVAHFLPRMWLIRHPTPDAFGYQEWWGWPDLHFAYIDGCHRADAVLSDLVHVAARMRPEGAIIVDDYVWEDSPPDLYGGVKRAVHAFLGCQPAVWEWRLDLMGVCAILRRTQEPS